MVKQKQIKIVGQFWMALGVLLSLWCVIELWDILTPIKYFRSGPFITTLIGLLFCIFSFMAGSALTQRKGWGGDAIFILSIIALLYGAIYILFAGFEDTSIIYAIVVLTLIVMSIFSIWVVYFNNITALFRNET